MADILFSTVFLFTFREASKMAISWGAFEFRNRPDLLVKKLFLLSFPLLVALPFAAYIPLSATVHGLTPVSLDFRTLSRDLFATGIAITWLGLFPFAAKHAWLLLARHRITTARRRGDSGEGWVKSSVKRIDDELPPMIYSWQVIGVLGLVPAGIVGYRWWRHALVAPMGGWVTVFVGGYVSQLVILTHIAKLRRYFYRHANPRWLMSLRMWITIPVSIVLPIAFGVEWYSLVLRLMRTWNWALFAYIMLSLPFPLYCHQTMLILAKRFEWVRRQEDSEVFDAAPWVWYTCACMMVLCLITLPYSIRWSATL